MEKCLDKQSRIKVKHVQLRNGNEEHICSVCGEIHTIHGLGTHLKYKHPDYSIGKYVSEFGEYRRKEKLRIETLVKNSFVCSICNNHFVSDRELSYHLRIEHNLNKMDYVKYYIHKDKPPLCKCGCGEIVSMLEQFPYRRDYHAHHNSGVRLPFVMTEKSEKQFQRDSSKEWNQRNKQNQNCYLRNSWIATQLNTFHKKLLV